MNRKRAFYKNISKVILVDVLWHTEDLQPSFLNEKEILFRDKFLIEEYGYKEVKKYFVSMINSIYNSTKNHGLNITFDFEYLPWTEFKDIIKIDGRREYLTRYMM